MSAQPLQFRRIQNVLQVYQQTCRLDVTSIASSAAKMQLFVNSRYSKPDFLHFEVCLGEEVKEKTPSS